MALTLRKLDAQRPHIRHRLPEDHKPSAMAALVERVRTDNDYLGSLIFEGRGRKIIECILLGYIGLATAVLVGREIIVRIGGH